MPRFDDDRDDRDDEYDRPGPSRKRGMGVGMILLIVAGVLVVCGGLVIGGGIFAVSGVRESANRMKSSNNLKQIGLAMHNYNDTNGELPSNTYSADGKPLLSWRVHILPYVEQDRLYRQFKLDEPWDSPNNLPLLAQMPPVYARPNVPRSTTTYYRGFSSPGAVFERRLVPDQWPRPKKDQLSVAEFTDGTSNTIMVVEAGDPVEWTRPDDLDASPGKPFPKMGGHEWRNGLFQALMGDGSVRTLKPDMPESTLRALVTHSGNDPLPPGWDK
jgi:hypothetical protein